MMKRRIAAAPLCALFLVPVGAACGDDVDPDPDPDPDPEQCFETNLDLERCDPASASFTLDSTNPYYPLEVGSLTILEGVEDGMDLHIERRVLAETEEIGGVEVHVLDHKTYLDGEIHEIARNFYVEASDGTVCYFGEDVTFFEGGDPANNDGTWRVGEGGAKPGIIMPASPEVGDQYFQENAEGIAQDMGRVSAAGDTATFAGESYDDVLTIMDSNPLDAEATCEEEEKRYVRGIGEVVDTVARLVAYEPIAQCYAPSLDVSLCDPDTVSFSLDSTNTYYPLTPGIVVILEGEEDGELLRVERTVLAETEIVAGIETHILEHKAFIDGVIHEIARNFYVEADNGTVCYFGEDVTFFEDGAPANNDGTWKVGVDGAKPGVIMPATPAVGNSYYQEFAIGTALDMGRVIEIDGMVTAGGQDLENVVTIMDQNPMESCAEGEEIKQYAPGIGEIRDTVLVMIEVTTP